MSASSEPELAYLVQRNRVMELLRAECVLIVPAPDMCYGIEWEHGTNFISPFGGACE